MSAHILEQAKTLAEKQNKTLTSLIEEGLCKVIKEAQTPKPRRKIAIPIGKQTGGAWPGVDLSNSAELLDVMDGYLDPGGRQYPDQCLPA